MPNNNSILKVQLNKEKDSLLQPVVFLLFNVLIRAVHWIWLRPELNYSYLERLGDWRSRVQTGTDHYRLDWIAQGVGHQAGKRGRQNGKTQLRS